MKIFYLNQEKIQQSELFKLFKIKAELSSINDD